MYRTDQGRGTVDKRPIKVILHTKGKQVDHILRIILLSMDAVTLLSCNSNKSSKLPSGEGVLISEYSPEMVLSPIRKDQKTRWPRLLVGPKLSCLEEANIFQAGEAGYLALPIQLPFLAKSISEIASGGLWFSRDVLFNVQKSLVHGSRATPAKCNAELIKTLLTPREYMVNQSVCMGLRNKEVAELLSISEKTVKLHLNRIFKKLSISSRGELMALDRNFLRLSYDCSSEQPVY